MNQTNLLENMIKFNNKFTSKAKKDKDKKLNMFNSVSALYEGRELTLNAFKGWIFPKKQHKEKDWKY